MVSHKEHLAPSSPCVGDPMQLGALSVLISAVTLYNILVLGKMT